MDDVENLFWIMHPTVDLFWIMHATAAGDCGVNYTYAGFWCPKCAGLLKLRIEYKINRNWSSSCDHNWSELNWSELIRIDLNCFNPHNSVFPHPSLPYKTTKNDVANCLLYLLNECEFSKIYIWYTNIPTYYTYNKKNFVWRMTSVTKAKSVASQNKWLVRKRKCVKELKK